MRDFKAGMDHFEVCDKIYGYAKVKADKEISLLDKLYLKNKSKFQEQEKQNIFLTNVKSFDASDAPTNSKIKLFIDFSFICWGEDLFQQAIEHNQP